MIFASVNVEVDISEVIEELSDKQLTEVLGVVSDRLQLSKPLADVSPSEIEALTERAYLAARNVPGLPRAIADFFWTVHGRAIP